MDTENKKGLFARMMSPDASYVKHGKTMAIVSGMILLVGIIIIAIFNFNLGLEFTGGTILTVEQVQSIADVEVYQGFEEQISQKLSSEFGIGPVELQRQESSTGYSMTVLYNKEDADVAAVQAAIESITGGTVTRVDDLDPKMGSEHLLTAIIAVTAALICILIYIALRFKFTSGVAAIIGLFHDALIMMALVAITRIQVNASFVAALITVIAYSINNTLVLFDRVRDVEKDKTAHLTTKQITDRSIKETLGRTLNTTITTLVPIFVLSIIGIPLIREFAVPIIFGLVAGTFSTIFLTSSLYVRFETARLVKQRQKASAKL